MFKQLLVAVLALGVGTAAAAQAQPELAYALEEGLNQNLFLRDGPVAAHVLLRSGTRPRLLLAFPAGNSGAGLWFEAVATPLRWRVEAPAVAVSRPDAQGRPRHGVRIGVSVATPRLVPRQALATSVRYLRDYEAVGRYPAAVAAPLRTVDGGLRLERDRADGAAGYALSLTLTAGRVEGGALVAGPDGRIAFTLEALTGDPPLSGLAEPVLLTAAAAPDAAARRALAFLSYRDKFLAGSWRFNTYFGRDTLMSVALLMAALQPEAVEAGLASVLTRLSDGGEVAHEEAIGEYGVLARRAPVATAAAVTQPPAAPVELDFKMVDDDYMLAPVAARYLLERADRAAALRFLARPLARDLAPAQPESAGRLMVRNLRLVVASARPFARTPGWRQLIAIKPPFKAGQWRDSDDGLAGGTYAYDVNAVHVPAALAAAQRLIASGLLDPYLTAADRRELAGAGALAAAWARAAPPLFRARIAAAPAAAAAAAYARSLGVPADAARGPAAPLAFHAIALDAAGRPIPVLHSDEGFALFFTEPPAETLNREVAAVLQPFPRGLLTGAGLAAANAAHASADIQARFATSAYHGAGVWSWQQALMAAGLARQLARRDLPAATRAMLADAQARLWAVIIATRPFANSELWSWTWADGRYQVVPFGAGKADADESNAAQLWSTVYLAVQPPAGFRPPPESPSPSAGRGPDRGSAPSAP
jgi:hypothetical protein